MAKREDGLNLFYRLLQGRAFPDENDATSELSKWLPSERNSI